MKFIKHVVLSVTILIPISAYAGDDASLIKTRFVYEVPPTVDIEN